VFRHANGVNREGVESCGAEGGNWKTEQKHGNWERVDDCMIDVCGGMGLYDYGRLWDG